MKHEELLLSAMDGVKEELLMEAYEYKREKAVIRKRGILIAAAAAAVLAVTAGAVTLSMRDSARADLGIDDPEKIEEYTEYEPGQAAQAEAEAIKDDLKAYMIDNDTDEMNVDVFKIRYAVVKGSRFDTAAFKKTHADLYAQYTRQTETRRFTVA